MPIFLAALFGGLVQLAGSMVGRVLIALGIGYATYTGVSSGIGAIQSTVQGYFTGAPATIVAMLGMLKADVCVSILVSAIVARLTLNGLTGGSLAKAFVKP
jgi:hypothetical protein